MGRPRLPTRLLVLAGVLAFFLAAYPVVYRSLGTLASGLVIPVLFAAGWAFGRRGVIVAWIVWWPFNVLLRHALGAPFVPVTEAFLGFLGAMVAAGFARLLHLQERLAEERAALAESEARFRVLSEMSFEGIVIDQGGVLLDVNETFARMSGYARDDLLGATGEKLLDMRVSRPPVPGPPEGQMVVEGSLQPRHGERLDVEIVTRPLRYRGAQARASGVRDITQRRRQEALQAQGERLAALGTLVAGVAHEINNPLTYIKGNLEMIQLSAADLRRDPASAAARETAGDIETGALAAIEGVARIAAIARSLRQVAKPSGGERTREDVNVLVSQVLATASSRMGAGVAVVTRLEARQRVSANAGEISQVVLNLILNAADAVAREPSGLVQVRTRDEGASVVLEVEDNGPGVPPANQARLFTPFFTTRPEGTGLGLSISRAIAQGHGGDLTFEAPATRGARFRVRLPAAAPTPLQEMTA